MDGEGRMTDIQTPERLKVLEMIEKLEGCAMKYNSQHTTENEKALYTAEADLLSAIENYKEVVC